MVLPGLPLHWIVLLYWHRITILFIYLGGVFAGQTQWFTKKVTVIGVGHNPDSTTATDRTFINGYIGFQAGGTLDGVFVLGDVYISSNLKIYRTNCNSIIPAWTHTENVTVEKSVIRLNITGNTGGYLLAYSLVKNSIIGNDFTSAMTGTTFENCVFLSTGAYDASGAESNTFRNCTFTGITNWISGHTHIFRNCVFATATLPPLSDPGNASGNYLNQTGALTFDVAPITSYEYTNEYKIKTSSPAHNGGTDGKDVGIWGGNSPWVKGNVPPNPHIRSKNVDGATGAGGTLRVRFNVGAQ